MVFYVWFIVVKKYIREKVFLYIGFFGRDYRLKREIDFFYIVTFFKNVRKSFIESKLYIVIIVK